MNERPVPFAGDDDLIARRLRRALAEEADMVHTDDGAYERLSERIADDKPSRPWLPWVGGLAAATVVGVVVGAVIVGGQDDGRTPVASPSVSESSEPASASETSTPPSETSPAPSGTTVVATVKGVPVYWVGESKTSFWLYREFRDVPDSGSPVVTAVAAMMTQEPLDPDYSSPWSPPSRIDVQQSGKSLTVDLSADAFANTDVGSELAEVAVQQLVYTATAAAEVAGDPATTVTITVDGAPYDAWGVVRLGEPMQRARMMDVQASTWILSPAQGETVPAGEVDFTGYGTAFEANFLWEVRDASGGVVADGFTTGKGGNGTFGEFSFTAELRPGSYTVEVYQPDESGGESDEGPRLYPDTKEFTVR